MKKLTSLLLILMLLITLTSCEKLVTYVDRPSEKDASTYSEITEIDVGGSDEVIFHTYEKIQNVSVNMMDYNYETDEYTVKETVFSKKSLAVSNALRIKLDLKNDVPYVMVEYTRTNGETRQQYIHETGGKLWLLELEE